MKRIRKAGMTALFVVASMALLGVSSASASTFEAGSNPATLKGVPPSTHKISYSLQPLTCETKTFTNAMHGDAQRLAQLAMPNAACQNSLEDSTLEMKGCAFSFSVGGETGTPGVFKGTFDIADGDWGLCGEGMILNGTSCDWTIFQAQGYDGVTYREIGSGSKAAIEITVDESLHGVRTGGTTPICGDAKTLLYQGSWVVSAYATGGSQVQLGIDPEGEGGQSGGNQYFEAEEYPAAISGSQGAAHLFTLGLRKIECNEVSADAGLSGPSNSLSTDASYAGCASSGLPATVSMNGCDYVLHGATTDIACPSGPIEVKVYHSGKPLCTYRLAAQSGLKSTGTSNFIWEDTGLMGIDVDLNLASVAFTLEGPKLVCGSATSGTYVGDLKLRGEDEGGQPIGIR